MQASGADASGPWEPGPQAALAVVGGTPPEAQEPTSEAWLGRKEPAPLKLLIKTQRVSSRLRSSEEGPGDADSWGVLGSEAPGRLDCSTAALQLGTWP